MGASDNIATPVARSVNNDGPDIIQVQNADELRLAQMGAFYPTKAATIQGGGGRKVPAAYFLFRS